MMAGSPSLYEALDHHHARLWREAYWSPEAIETHRQTHQAITDGIVQAVGCSDCGAPAGSSCIGVQTSSDHHFARGMAYARQGGALNV